MLLSLALQSMAIEWEKELLSQKDFMQMNKISLQNQHDSKMPHKSALLTFKLRASENTRDVFDNEHTNFCTIADKTKNKYQICLVNSSCTCLIGK